MPLLNHTGKYVGNWSGLFGWALLGGVESALWCSGKCAVSVRSA